jgi:hypothetical protein
VSAVLVEEPFDALNDFGAVALADGEADSCFLRGEREIG